ncbi:MAG: MoxR family ATPase [Chloroflexi bacterium]|nr:MoxR family ATPase [Chloroflexota bacterium]HLG51618.1 MoxR family ATPase [Chloroflexota bacterium]
MNEDLDLTPDEFRARAREIEEALAAVIVGQQEVVRGVLIAVLAGGHVLLEGAPGLGKTMLVRTLGEVLRLDFSRIQFTPDLMPADITGTTIIVEDAAGHKTFQFQPGPIFAHLVLADEVNRATPKTQAALLEAMQEHRVTVARVSYPLPEPFLVLATQNPIEMEGTYPLPEAQLDRFFFKLTVRYPSLDDLVDIAARTTGAPAPVVSPVADGPMVLRMTALARELPVATPVLRYAAHIVQNSHPDAPDSPPAVRRFVRYGASPRGVQALVLAGKIRALLEGRLNVAFADVRAAAHPALRHRIILNFEADAEGVSSDQIIDAILAATPEV